MNQPKIHFGLSIGITALFRRHRKITDDSMRGYLNWKFRLRKWLILFSILFWGVTFDAMACTCPPINAKSMRELARQQSQQTQVVFEGVVIRQKLQAGHARIPVNVFSITFRNTHRIVIVKVMRIYRGHLKQYVSIVTGYGDSDCGFDFETHHAYLIYANWIEHGRFLFTSICTGTAPIEHSGPELRYLRGEPASPEDQLNPEQYWARHEAQWYATLCGRVTKADGSPAENIDVEMWQIRSHWLPPYQAGDPNLSKPDGRYCIPLLRTGQYILTAEFDNFQQYTRWVAYYPGVMKYSKADKINIRAGSHLKRYNFTLQRQQLYTISFYIKSLDSKPLPYSNIGIAIDSPTRNALGYHEWHVLTGTGSNSFGLIPAGRYIVRTFIIPRPNNGTFPASILDWHMIKKTIILRSNATYHLVLKPISP